MDGMRLKAIVLVPLLLLVLVLLLSQVEARAINDGKVKKLVNKFSFEEAKNEGPSPGVGHKSPASSLGGMEESGPSPGQGH